MNTIKIGVNPKKKLLDHARSMAEAESEKSRNVAPSARTSTKNGVIAPKTAEQAAEK